MTPTGGARRTHFVGIAGSGMSSLAGVLGELGESISGCDLHPNRQTAVLERRGAKVYEGHDAGHLEGVDRVIGTHASMSQPEVARARALGLPVRDRSEVLGQLMEERRGIAVAGTHGKTTTSSLLAWILTEAGADPTVLIGGVPAGWDLGGRLGRGPWLVAEADEWKGSFLHLHPELTVLTGVDWDHPDTYPTLEATVRGYEVYLAGCRPGATIFPYAESARAVEVARRVAADRGFGVETYGTGEDTAWRCRAVGRKGPRVQFAVEGGGERIDGLELALAGEHNLLNATAAVAVARAVGVAPDAIRAALSTFRGVGRRFELKGEAAGVTIVDDYAHNPEKIEAAVHTARVAYPEAAVWVAFQPHTYSRTRALLGELAAALALADRAYVLDIYGGRETPDPVITGERVAGLVEGAVYVGGVPDAAERIARDARPGTLVMTVGAGTITELGPLLLSRLRGEVAR